MKMPTVCCTLLLCFSGIIPIIIGPNQFEISLGLCCSDIDTENSFFPSGEILIEIENDESGIISNQFIMNQPIRADQNLIAQNIPAIAIDDTPDEFSWKNYQGKDWTTPAKDQAFPKYCGSCWDFAAIGALESIINIREGDPDLDLDLSEQYVLSCLPSAANIKGEGCSGGNPYNAYFYIMNTSSEGNNCNGIITEKCFPYQADDNIPCSEKCNNWMNFLIPISDCGYCWTGNGTNGSFDSNARDVIKTQIFQFGPVAAAMDATTSFMNWGFTNHDVNDYYPYVEQSWRYLNHVIVIVGWKDDPSITNGGYWICKNSWGSDWGYDGFFNVEYECMFTGLFISWVDYDPNYDSYPPNKPDTPVGPSSGKINEDIIFSCTATDPDDDRIFYLWDWGDDSNSGWLGPYNSGDKCNAIHNWTEQGDFNIRVRAKDEYNKEGPWSDPLPITMPYVKIWNPFFILIFERMTERFLFLRSVMGRLV